MSARGQVSSMTVAEIASLVDGKTVGDSSRKITGIGRLESARPAEVTFLSNEKFSKFLPVTEAGCVIISEHLLPENEESMSSLIVCKDAYRGFVKIMQEFFPPTVMQPGERSPLAYIDEDSSVDATAAIGPGCVVNKGCVVGPGVQLYANVVLYPNVTIGNNTVIHANVSVCTGSKVGTDGIIHSGTVIGADGFGFFEDPDGSFEKIPQVGNVVIGDRVEIGSNVCIDRAAVGSTVIEDGVKLDNLIHIAHGVRIGTDSAVAAQAGISGSAMIGARNRIAGQVGIVGHISTTEDVIVEAQSGLMKSVTTSGAYFGSPAKEHRTALRMEAALRRLPEMMREFQELQRIVAELNDKDK